MVVRGLASILLLYAVVPRAYADTYGLPPCTAFEREWKIQETALKGPNTVVIRSPNEWRTLWREHTRQTQEIPAIDFEQFMVVGIAGGEKEGLRAIYRIELDDPANPTELLVRVARDSALCQRPQSHTIKGARLHLVAIGKSALPVRFVLDDMVDGDLFGIAGGIEETVLGRIAGPGPGERSTLRADYREQAEKLARGSLTETEITAAKKALWPGTYGDRYPQLWSVIDVRRVDEKWTVHYDEFRFEVDVATGKVSRLNSLPDE